MTITVEPLAGPPTTEALAAVARLRVTVFREWPYLYDGTVEYEQEYLRTFSAATGSLIVAAKDVNEIVGVATAAPLSQHTSEFMPLFAAHGLDPERIFYFGESVLLPEYRGRGLGHAFFDHREAHARRAASGPDAYTHTAFCSVIRPADHPARPRHYHPLDAFWAKRGYTPVDGLIGHYAWKDVGAAAETEKPMQFWVRPL